MIGYETNTKNLVQRNPFFAAAIWNVILGQHHSCNAASTGGGK